MLMFYLTVGVIAFAVVSYVYGFITEQKHGYWTSRKRPTVETIPHADDPWSLILFDCDFGASSQTNGPARTLSVRMTEKPHR